MDSKNFTVPGSVKTEYFSSAWAMNITPSATRRRRAA
jgi:hypothetical protein